MSEEKETETQTGIESIEPEGADKGFETIRTTKLIHNHKYGLIGIEQDRAVTNNEGGEKFTERVFITEGLFDSLIDALHRMNRHMENPDEDY